MSQLIAIKKRNSILLSNNDVGCSKNLLLSFNAELMNLGYILSENAFAFLQTRGDERELISAYPHIINSIRAIKGADVNYHPMYPNFPEQVMEASECELYFNAILHYWTYGEWKPQYETLRRDRAFESVNYVNLDVINESEFNFILGSILSSKDSISEEDKSFVKYFFKKGALSGLPEEIPFKENLALVGAYLVNNNMSADRYVSNATDVLRIATAMSEGDVSLAENTNFKSLKRKQRKLLLSSLEKVIREEDIQRHANKWVKLFHNLHVGDYKFKKVNNISYQLRNNGKLRTFNSKVEAAIKDKDYFAAVDLLTQRPGEFARRLGNILTLTKSSNIVVSAFLSVADQVPTRNLTQLVGSLKSRMDNVNTRIVFPKGNTQKAIKISSELPALRETSLTLLLSGIADILRKRFEDLPELGKVYVDPQLDSCPLPTQMRSASTGAFNVARGTRIPFGDDNNTLRFFIYWKGMDIDLSATMHDENFKMIERIAYTNLKSDGYEACHSGDITRATNGASEFIDITVDKAYKAGARYVAMNVLVYNGPSFKDHEICYAGWMTRSKPKSNEIYDPKTVKQKVDLTVGSRRAVPVIFDLKTREAIWVDLAGACQTYYGGNNVESNKANIEEVIEAMNSLDNKVTLGELFRLHAESRGQLVESKEEADTVFSFDGNVTPYDINTINSEFLV